MQGIDLSKVVAINRKGNRQGEFANIVEQRPEEQAPVMDTFLAFDANLPNRPEQRHDFLKLKRYWMPARFVSFQKGNHAVRKAFCGVDGIENLAVTLL